MKFEYAIDIGSMHTSIYKRDEGIILKEPTLITVKNENSNYSIIAIGEDCQKKEIQEQDSIITFSPVSEGCIQSTDYTALFLKHIFKKIFRDNKYKNAGWYVAVPCGLNTSDKQKYIKICKMAKLNKVETVLSILASAIGSGLDFDGNSIVFLVDIGASKTDIAVIDMFKIVQGATLGIGGRTIDTAIVEYLKEKQNILISDKQAEKLKIEIGTLISNDMSSMDIQGIDLETKSLRNCTIYAKDVRSCLNPIFDEIAKVIKATINECPENIQEKILNDTIYLTGTTANVLGIEEFFHNSVGIKFKLTNKIENAVIIGLGQLLR